MGGLSAVDDRTETLAIHVHELRHTWPGASGPTLDGMTFEVRTSEVFGFLGPSGAGKTTTQHVLTGLVRGWSGRAEVLGRDVRAWGSDLYDRIGVGFELPVGWPRLTGREDLAHFANLHDRQTHDPGALLDHVGLGAAADQPVGTWSKGMRTRLNLARALLHRPDLLFLDEPTAGLDPANVAMVRDLVRSARDDGATVFLTTHDMATATALCDRVAFVVDGRIVACRSPREFRLGAGDRQLRVEHRTPEGLVTSSFPLGAAPPELVDLLASGTVETVATDEVTLDEAFLALAGNRP